MAIQAFHLLEGEKADLIQEAEAVLGDYAQQWLDSENSRFAGETPRDLIESGEAEKQQYVRNLLRSIKHGMPT